MRGRKPETIVAGTMDDVPNAPTWLGKDAKAEWRRVAPILAVERKILTVADLPTLANYCAMIGRAIEAERQIATDGMFYVGASGPKRHPAVSLQKEAVGEARLLANELGLTPVSRSRPAIRNDGGEDEGSSDLGL